MRLGRFVRLVSPCILALTWLASITRVVAGNVTLAWDPDSDLNVVGYRLHSGTTSGVYTQTTEVGNVTAVSVSNLVNGNTYFFVVTAYDAAAVESAPSNEVSYIAPTPTPTPSPTPSSTATPTPAPSPTPTATPTPTPSPGPVVMVSPGPGSTFSSSSVTFTWSPGSASVYLLLVGSSQNGSDIYNSGQVTVLSKTVSNIPTDGRTIYVTLGSKLNSSWTLNSYTYKAFSLSATPTPTPTPSVTPTPGPTPTPTPTSTPTPTP